MNTREKDTYTLDDVCDLLDVMSWDEWENKTPDGTCTYSYIYGESLENGLTEFEAEEKALAAESIERDEHYHRWRKALMSVAETYFRYHKMGIRPMRDGCRFKITSANWGAAAEAIRQTINGVKDSIPLRSSRKRSSRKIALQHIHWIKRYGDVYGEYSPSSMMEKACRHG